MAIFSALWASLLAYLMTNGLALLARVGPFVMLAMVCIVQWATDTIWGKCQFVILMISMVVAGLDLFGKVPTFGPTVAPKA